MLLGYLADAQALLQALHASGFMKDRKINDWREHNGYHTAFSDRARKAAEARWEKEKGKDKTRKERKGKEPSIASRIACASGKNGKPENLESVIAYVRELGLPETDGHYYWDKWQAGGYVNGGKAIRDWKALIRSHKSAGYCPSQKRGFGASSFQKPKQVDPNQQRKDEEYEQWRRERSEKTK